MLQKVSRVPWVPETGVRLTFKSCAIIKKNIDDTYKKMYFMIKYPQVFFNHFWIKI